MPNYSKHNSALGKGKRTSQAIHCIRCIEEYAERARYKITMVLLDWEKAFDEIYNDKLF